MWIGIQVYGDLVKSRIGALNGDKSRIIADEGEFEVAYVGSLLVIVVGRGIGCNLVIESV